eukprot:scaffold137823_cov28-Tisochrysis_lutea.AAC.3
MPGKPADLGSFPASAPPIGYGVLWHKPYERCSSGRAVFGRMHSARYLYLQPSPEFVHRIPLGCRDSPLELVADTPETRRKGWQRIALFANFFISEPPAHPPLPCFPRPGSLVKLTSEQYYPPSFLPGSGRGPKSPMPELGWAGVLPFTWRESVAVAFDRFSADGKPTVAPIIQASCFPLLCRICAHYQDKGGDIIPLVRDNGNPCPTDSATHGQIIPRRPCHLHR